MMLRGPTEQPTVLRITALNCLVINNKQLAYLLKDEMLEIKKLDSNKVDLNLSVLITQL